MDARTVPPSQSFRCSTGVACQRIGSAQLQARQSANGVARNETVPLQRGYGSSGTSLPAPAAVSLVRGVAPEPSAFTTQMLRVVLVLAASMLVSSARCDEKKICVPPGDHIGKKLPAPAAVSFSRKQNQPQRDLSQKHEAIFTIGEESVLNKIGGSYFPMRRDGRGVTGAFRGFAWPR